MGKEKISIEAREQYSNSLAKFYTSFRVSERYLLTGHSHQAWPDCSFEAQTQAWLDAAKYVDSKWEIALRKAQEVQIGFSRLLEDESGFISLAPSTHDLLIRFLSGLDLAKRNKIITTDCEFHTIRRQLNLLGEHNFTQLVKVQGHPVDEVVSKMISQIDDNTAAVIISAVYFNSGQIVENLPSILEVGVQFGAKLLIDAYHALNVVLFSLKEQKLSEAYIIGGDINIVN